MNGHIDKAQTDAILSAGREQIDRYLVTFAIETRRTLDDLPSMIAEAVAEAVGRCQADHEDDGQRLEELWEDRTRATGVRGFWATTGKVLAGLSAGAGLVVTLVHFLA